MSPSQLHEVFHVNELDSVPHYELVKLTHLTTQHVRKKRSIESALPSSKISSSSSSISNTSSYNKLGYSANSVSNNLVNSNNNHHVKKDLSKSAPYPEKSSVSTSKSIFAKKEVELTPLITTTIVHDKSDKEEVVSNAKSNTKKGDDGEDFSDLSAIRQHQVTFDAFGEKLNLTLRPTEGLFRNGPQSLKMWHAHPDPNATDGINYEEVKSVSSFLLSPVLLHCRLIFPLTGFVKLISSS